MTDKGLVCRLLLLGTLLGLSGCAALNGQRTPIQSEAAVSKLAQRLTGAYNNHAQVWSLSQQGKPAPAQTRVVIEPAGGEEGERHLRYSQYRTAPGQDTLARRVRWILRPGVAPETVLQSVYQQQNGAWRELTGCGVHWRVTGAGYQGQTQGSDCRYRDQSSGQVVVFQRRYVLTPAGLTYRQSRLGPGADTRDESLQLARLVSYTGWAGVNPDHTGAPASGAWRLDNAVRVHNQGGTARLVGSDGEPLGYTIKLEQLVWPDSQIPMLRLSVQDSDTGETLAYAWAEPSATRIGLNLGWLQVGLERSQ